MSDRGGPPYLDVHRRLFQPELYPIDHDDVWSAAEAGDSGFHHLSVPEELVHAAMHFVKHGCPAVMPLVDIAEMARRDPLWDQVVARARRWSARSATFLALGLATDLLGAPVPDGVLAALRPGPAARAILGLVGERATASSVRERGRSRRVVERMAMLDGSLARLRYLFGFGAIWLLGRPFMSRGARGTP